MPLLATRAGDAAQGYGLFGGIQASYALGLYSTTDGYGIQISNDSSSNKYLSAYYAGASNNEGLVAKLNNSSIQQWQRKITYATSGVSIYGSTANSSGDLFATGYYGGATYSITCLLKYNSSGTLQWQRQLSTTNHVESYYMAGLDSSSNLYVIANLGNSPYGGNVVKYNSSGTLQWQRKLNSSTNYIALLGIFADSSGNSYVTTQDNNINFHVVKYNSSGTLQWQRKLYNGTNISEGNSVITDSSGNVYVVGHVNYVAIIAKYNSSGTLQWQRSLTASSGNSFFKSIGIDSSGNLYAAGWDSSSNAIIAKYNSSGTIQWQRKISSTGTSPSVRIYSINIDATDAISIIGFQRQNALRKIFYGKLPNDGSKTGTYTVGAETLVYAAGTATDAAGTATDAAGTLTDAAGSLTDAVGILTDAAGTQTLTTTTI